MDCGRNQDRWRRGKAEVSKLRTYNTGHRGHNEEVGLSRLAHGFQLFKRLEVTPYSIASGTCQWQEGRKQRLPVFWGLTGENCMWLSRIGSHYVFLESQAENTQFNLASIESHCRMGKGRSGLKTSGKLVRGWWCSVSHEKVKSSTPKTKGLQVWCKSEAFPIVPAENISGKFNFMWHPNSINQGEMVFLLGRFAYQP